jgi:hypothetical protein
MEDQLIVAFHSFISILVSYYISRVGVSIGDVSVLRRDSKRGDTSTSWCMLHVQPREKLEVHGDT